MKYPHTGLYHYCLEVGNALLNAQQSNDKSFHFYIPNKAMGIFGDRAHYFEQFSWHKFYLPNTKKYDLWHCTYQGSRYFPFNSKCKKVLTVHDINFLYDSRKSNKKKQKYLNDLQKKIDKVDHLIVISNFVKDQILEVVSAINKPISVIYNGCNINNSIEPRNPIQIPNGEFLFTIGTIVDKKNFHVLPRLLIDNSLQLIIAGIEQSTSYKQTIINEATRHNVLHRVHFVGMITEAEKYWYYKNCKAFVFPSLAEGFGLPVIEAMHFGIPVFLSTATSLPEIGGEEAYYFNSFDPDHMKDVLQSGLADYQINDKSKSIQKRAALFQWKNVAESYNKIYNQLLYNE